VKSEVFITAEPALLSRYQAAWDDLLARTPRYSQCQTFTYCQVAAEMAAASGGVVHLILLWEGETLLALWPLALHREGLLRILRPLSCGSNEEYSSPLVQTDDAEAHFADVLRVAIAIPADVLRVFNVEERSFLHKVIEAPPFALMPRKSDSLPTYSIGLRAYPTWDNYAARFSKFLRRDLRRDLQRLSAQGDVDRGWCVSAEDAEVVLTWLFARKRRWAEEGGLDSTWLGRDQVRDFFIELARRTDLTTTPLVTYVKLNGAPIAAAVNLIGSDVFEYFITTYDESFAHYAPGKMLIEVFAKWAHANERDFDFRFLHYAYKARWADREGRVWSYALYLTLLGKVSQLEYFQIKARRAFRKLRGLAQARMSIE
jgi:CelD/BcsL family acetyltransferase involved in cellulose biosynthesis